MSKRKAEQGIRLVREVLRPSRRSRATGPRLDSGAHVHAFIGNVMEEGQQEVFLGIYVDVKNAVIASELISLGTVDATLVHARDVYRPAIAVSAASVIVCHFHPSGDPEPSPEDLRLTERLADAGRLIGIPLLDHVILGSDRYVSLAERGVV